MCRPASSAERPHMPMPPSPPALLTAAASAGVVMMPIGAWMIGNLSFSLSVSGFDGHMLSSRLISNHDPLDLIQTDLITPAIVELLGARRGMVCHRRGLFQRAAVPQIGCDP